MRMTYLLAFAAPLAVLLPLSAQADNWPAGMKKSYMNDCVKEASQNVDAKTAQQRCACGGDKLSATLSTAEITELMSKTKEPSNELKAKAVGAIQSCKTEAKAKK